MMDAPQAPSYFAHKVIRQLVDHMYGPEVQLSRPLADAICRVFLSCGGKWTALASGEGLHFELLFTIVTSWFQGDRIVKEDPNLLP